MYVVNAATAFGSPVGNSSITILGALMHQRDANAVVCAAEKLELTSGKIGVDAPHTNENIAPSSSVCYTYCKVDL